MKISEMGMWEIDSRTYFSGFPEMGIMKLIQERIFLEIYEMGMKEIDARTYFSGKFELGFGGSVD